MPHAPKPALPVKDRIQRAASFYSERKFAEALAVVQPILESTVSVPPGLRAEALNAAAGCSLGLNRLADAETYWRQCIELQPDFAAAYDSLGRLLTSLKRPLEAVAIYQALQKLRPDYAEAYHNLGNVLCALNRLAEAEEAYTQALRRRPEIVEAHHNLGCVLGALGRLPEAVAHFQQAVALRPGYAEAHYNLGSTLKRLNRLPEAEAAFRQALALRPNYPDATFYLGTLLLGTGQYAQGWAFYESRYEHPGFAHHNSRVLLRCPQWQGDDLAGKSLLVWQEDGLGDMIQFGRYLALLKARGAATMTFACAPALRRLMATVDGVDAVVDHETALSQSSRFDCWTSLLSAPWHLRTTLETIPPPLHLVPEPSIVERWRLRLATLAPGRKVGLVWKGNPQHHNDANRSLASLATLAPLWSLPDVGFVSLQKGQGEDEAQCPPADQPLVHLGPEVVDLADSAAIISQLDLVVCVDTAIAHLAASLRTPCWILLPATGVDWRWMQERDDSPWYPDVVRLFRRSEGESWLATVERVRQAYIEQFVTPVRQG